jgi:hypothetical protein
MVRTLPTDKNVAKFAAYSAARDPDKCGTCGMLAPCLIHPVTPLLSLLAPLFRPFRSPVRGLRCAMTERGKPLTLLAFCSDFALHAGGKGVFSPVIWLKQGSARFRCRRSRGRRQAVRRFPCHSAGRVKFYPAERSLVTTHRVTNPLICTAESPTDRVRLVAYLRIFPAGRERHQREAVGGHVLTLRPTRLRPPPGWGAFG